MSEESASFSVRMSRSLRARLDERAQEEGISTARLIIRYVERGLLDEATTARSDLDPFLAVMASRVSRMEQRTGKQWREDAFTYGAVRLVAERMFRAERPPLENQARYMELTQQANQLRVKLFGLLDSLVEAGVLRRLPSESIRGGRRSLDSLRHSVEQTAQEGDYQPYSDDRNEELEDCLAHQGYALKLNPRSDPNHWPVKDGTGGPASVEESFGLKASLACVLPWAEQWSHYEGLRQEIFFADHDIVRAGRTFARQTLAAENEEEDD